MNGRKAIALLLLLTTGTAPPGWGAFFSHRSLAISASATVGSGGFLLQATPLPGSAFFGKNVVIPVELTGKGVVNMQTLSASILYQLVDPNGVPLAPPVTVPITFAGSAAAAVHAAGSGSSSVSLPIKGTAVIPMSDLEPIRHGGGLQYILQAQQGGYHTLLTQAGTQQMTGTVGSLPSPYQTMIIDELCQAVVPEGSVVRVPDLFENDGQTSVVLGPGAVAAPGTLCIKRVDAESLPPGPGGVNPVVAYSVTLKDSSLSQTAQLILSYPSDANGKVLNFNVNAGDLAIYSLGQGGDSLSDQQWYLLSRPQVDTTLHTVTGATPHFSTFALFAGSSDSNAALRPPQRIITPNGDPFNAKAIFGSGIDEVKIFDIRGRRVRTIPGPAPQWDGTGDDGAIVESGVYIYQYTAQGDRVSGVIMVAK